MIINQISFCNEGYVHCHSRFYSALDILSHNNNYIFTRGINVLRGEIDSGIWATSYLLSMYHSERKNMMLFDDDVVIVNGEIVGLDVLSKDFCYLDPIYPLFAAKKTLGSAITRALKKSSLDYTIEYIIDLFGIKPEFIERNLLQTGNEIFKAMAAIGYCCGKQGFCFPWLSKRRFDGYHANISWLLDRLNSLDTIVILPLDKE